MANSLTDIIKNKVQIEEVSVENINFDDILHEEFENERDFIIYILKNRPTNVLNFILPYVTVKDITEHITLECDDTGDGLIDNLSIYSEFKISGFSRVNYLSLYEYGILVPPDELVNDITVSGYEINNLHIESYNNMSGEVKLSGSLLGGRSGVLSADYNDNIVKLQVWGIEKETETPSWVEYLFESCYDIENGNYKMAFFNVSAAFDNFINIIHEYMFDYYLEEYKACENENIKGDIKEKIRMFSNKEKRLRDKLRHIFKELNMTKNQGFEKLNKLFDIWDKKYIKVRDKIAHGGLYEETYDIGEVMYVILTLIFSILRQEDLAENEWSTLITE